MIRKELWLNLIDINHNKQNLPWIVLGDFNAVLPPNNKKGGVPLSYNDYKLFLNCVNDSELIEIPISGSPFTWHKHDVHERLDWSFAMLLGLIFSLRLMCVILLKLSLIIVLFFRTL